MSPRFIDVLRTTISHDTLEVSWSGICRWFGKGLHVPKKIRELMADLETAGFVNRGGKGSHRNFVHPGVARPVTLSGKPGDDAKRYQERAVKLAIEESQR